MNNTIEREDSAYALTTEKIHTLEDIYALPEGQRAELIDGQMYMIAPPSTIHQHLVSELTITIENYIRSKAGNCTIFPAPFAVFLNRNDLNYVEPDITVICDKEKITEKGCNGAPDWIIEVVSPSTSRMNYGIKLFKYRSAGVQEYWIVNSKTRTVNLFDFDHDKMSNQYSFEDTIPVCIYEDLEINIAELLS